MSSLLTQPPNADCLKDAPASHVATELFGGGAESGRDRFDTAARPFNRLVARSGRVPTRLGRVRVDWHFNLRLAVDHALSRKRVRGSALLTPLFHRIKQVRRLVDPRTSAA